LPHTTDSDPQIADDDVAQRRHRCEVCVDDESDPRVQLEAGDDQQGMP
jgi:hypothetical protein